MHITRAGLLVIVVTLAAAAASASAGPDPYKILGVSRSASPQEITKAYRRLSQKWHPDKNPTRKEQATSKFQEIANAYEILNDPRKRRAYEAFQEQQHWQEQQQQQWKRPGRQQQQQQQWQRPEPEDIPEEYREFFEAFLRAHIKEHHRQHMAGTVFDWDGSFFEWDGGSTFTFNVNMEEGWEAFKEVVVGLARPFLEKHFDWRPGMLKEPVAVTTCWGISRLQQLYFYLKPEHTSGYSWQLLAAVNDWLMDAAPCKPHASEEDVNSSSHSSSSTGSGYPDAAEDRESRRRRVKEEMRRKSSSGGGGGGSGDTGGGGKEGGSYRKRAWDRFLRRVHGAVLWGGVLLLLLKPVQLWSVPGVLAFLLLDVWSPSPEFVSLMAGQVAERGPIAALIAVGITQAAAFGALVVPLLALQYIGGFILRLIMHIPFLVAAVGAALLPTGAVLAGAGLCAYFFLANPIVGLLLAFTAASFAIQRGIFSSLFGAIFIPLTTAIEYGTVAMQFQTYRKQEQQRRQHQAARDAAVAAARVRVASPDAAATAGAAAGRAAVAGRKPGSAGPGVVVRPPLALFPTGLTPRGAAVWAFGWGWLSAEAGERMLSAAVGVVRASLMAWCTLMLLASISTLTEASVAGISAQKFFGGYVVQLVPTAINLMMCVKLFPLLMSLFSG